MAISRPLLLALIAAILALVAFYATSGARESATDAGDAAQPAPERRPAPANEAPEPSAKAAGAKGRSAGEQVRPARPERRRQPATAAAGGLPADVSRAVAGKRTVVLFFFQRGSADDAATARSVSSLRGRPGVRVFSAPISRLGDYQALIGGVGVTQAPAVVILGRDRAARLIEGYVDPETLAQQVADAR